MTSRYFIAKWNFDPRARRECSRAIAVIEHAKDHILNTRAFWISDFDIEPFAEDALRMFDAAITRVLAAHDAAQLVAAKAAA